MSTPVIIEAAINGVTAPERNPSVPRSPAEIAADAVRCLAAGAAIVHSHNAEFVVDGARAAELYLEAWRPVLRERPDAIFYPTTGVGRRSRSATPTRCCSRKPGCCAWASSTPAR